MTSDSNSRTRRSTAQSAVATGLHGESCSHAALRRVAPGRVKAGFTLPEILLVITIIAILLGMLYSAIRTVSRYSRETITRSELASIEAAWRHYYDYYHAWPTNRIEAAVYAYEQDPNGDIKYEIGPVLARMLQGTALTNDLVSVVNADAIPFLELTRFEKGTAAPINAWGDLNGQRYVVKLDISGDNTLSVPVDSTGTTTTNILRRVAAWTINPDKTDSSGHNLIIGSWQQ